MLRSTNAFFEGGLNTIERVFPPGFTGGDIVGVMPKKGRIINVRVHGDAAETLTNVRVRGLQLTGAPGFDITDPTFDITFASSDAAYTGVELPLVSDQGALYLMPFQTLIVAISTGTTVGDLAVVIQFEPSA